MPPSASYSCGDNGSVTPTRENVSRFCPASQPISSVRPCPSGCSAPARNPASKSAGTSAAVTGPYATRPPSVPTSTSGSSQSSPRDPFRTTVTSTPRRAASADTAAATSSAPTERAEESLGT